MSSSPTNDRKQISSVLDSWVPPKGTFLTGLHVSNSLAGKKVPFVPQSGKTVNWYGCGPTVYDSAHMGHARNYITFDVLRRIMEDYFGYNVNMCMNVTDIDDKIIAKASELNIPFHQLARYWENDFWKCMIGLNCRLPDFITRVSEYVPHIVSFIEEIIRNDYGYESGGSVYFDTSSFRNSSKHVYGRMEPWSINDEARVLEGEGALGESTEKKSPLDFALWKKAKAGEPSWDSPWGKGRPGWHIECSCMASDVLGDTLDIHSGGIDLRFPHHDNELAQSEAAKDKPHWVHYFLHSGHLHIQGLKMSKSLKNFITIQKILESYPARVVRLLVLLHRWDQPMNYNPDGSSMKEPAEYDRVAVNFFANLKQIVRKCGAPNATWNSPSEVDLSQVTGLNEPQRMNDADRNLWKKIAECQDEVDKAFCDNFDTTSALLAISALISQCNIYLRENKEYKASLLHKVATYVHRIYKVLGLVESSDPYSYGLDTESQAGANNEQFYKLMDLFGEFRHEVRDKCRAVMRKKEPADPRETAMGLLKSCDEIRDKKLLPIGIRLEDSGDKGFVWKEVAATKGDE